MTRFEACRKQYFVQKILYCVVSLYYLSAPDRDGASPNSNCKYETCLIFSTLDQSASDVIPMIANESEQASLTGCCASIAETWQPQTCRESREHHPCYTHCYTLSRFILRVSVRSRVTFYNHQVCGLAVWLNLLVCAFSGL